MNHADIDRRLGLLLADPTPAADPAFADRIVAAALIDRSFREARQRAWRGAVLDCAAAVAVGASFFLLSQTEHDSIAGMISLQGPAMAGLIMLGLWAMVALPASAGYRRGPRTG
jgi:Na+/proline symporter